MKNGYFKSILAFITEAPWHSDVSWQILSAECFTALQAKKLCRDGHLCCFVLHPVYNINCLLVDEGVSFKHQALIFEVSGGIKEALDDSPSCKWGERVLLCRSAGRALVIMPGAVLWSSCICCKSYCAWWCDAPCTGRFSALTDVVWQYLPYHRKWSVIVSKSKIHRRKSIWNLNLKIFTQFLLNVFKWLSED